MPSRYDQDIKAKAIRLVRDHAGDYDSEWAAISAVAGRLGMTAETLRKWIRQTEIAAGQRPAAPKAPQRKEHQAHRPQLAIITIPASRSTTRPGVSPPAPARSREPPAAPQSASSAQAANR